MEYKNLKALVDQGRLEYSAYLEQAALALGLAVEREDSMLVLKTPIELLLPEQIKSRVTRDLKLEFHQGRPQSLTAVLVLKSAEEWRRFLDFMRVYAEEHDLSFESAEGVS